MRIRWRFPLILPAALIAAVVQAQPPLTPDGQSAFDSALVNAAFRDLDDEEIRRFEPIVEERFLRRSRASRYRQHRLVAIDAAAFKKQLPRYVGITFFTAHRIYQPFNQVPV